MSGTGRAATAGRWGLVVLVLVLLVVPGRLLASEHDNDDDALLPYSGHQAADVPTGQTWHVSAGVLAAEDDRLQVVEVRPRVAVDTAEADITVRVCRPAPQGGLRSGTGAAVDGCADLLDVPTRGTVRLAPGAAEVVVTVTPRRPGRVQIDGYDVTYVDGDHRGTEHAGRALVLTAV